MTGPAGASTLDARTVDDARAGGQATGSRCSVARSRRRCMPVWRGGRHTCRRGGFARHRTTTA
ncbi:hypothetical protein C7S13_8312 [Burkholderia cepacia]|nr:hypothetical protein [Burkholderia cepacia]QOH36189.1 hypothetical protein C7S14_7208 [Burkholderia cepacia]